MAQTTSPSQNATFRARAARVDTAAQGLSTAQASPLAAETPIRTPVKDPGPAETATASRSARAMPVFFSKSSTRGIRVRLWVSPVSW